MFKCITQRREVLHIEERYIVIDIPDDTTAEELQKLAEDHDVFDSDDLIGESIEWDNNEVGDEPQLLDGIVDNIDADEGMIDITFVRQPDGELVPLNDDDVERLLRRARSEANQ